MALILPKKRAYRRESNATGQPSTTWGTILTSDGTTNVEPATPTQIIASTSFDTDWVNLYFHTNGLAATDTDSLVNIKVGGAGSEVTLIPNLLAGYLPAAFTTAARTYSFPLRIPSGTRISGTHRSVRLSTGVTVIIELLGGGQTDHWVGTGVEQVGAVTASSTGTYITPGTASEGTFTALATTTQEWGFVHLQSGGNIDTTATAAIISGDLGAGSVLLDGLDNWVWITNASEWTYNINLGRFAKVPASTALQARLQSSVLIEGQATVCYGVY